jgi:peptidoglycan/LPS O-acetylase OafA/YrhL
VQYRAEIDGLRAVAVIPVILFHAGFQAFSGGFVGVDVFFVISGYLITTIILADLDAGKFSIGRFYERRARRILPALFAVMILCAVPAYLTMLPDELQNFGQSVVASTLMANNVLSVMTSGYWALDSGFKPLLHTWSLGVEEQYYVLFPLLLIAGWRLGRRNLLSLLGVLFVLSLGAAQWAAPRHPEANFFLLPTRGWEILVGAFVAFALHQRPSIKGSPTQLQVLSLAGLLLIGFSIVAYTEETPFPSAYTLAPTIGTALVILYAAPGTFANRILSTRVAVGIGLISYSAYLLHQPLMAYARLVATEPVRPAILLVLVALTLAGAWLIWRFIEAPFRDRTRVPVRRLVTSMAACSIILLGAGVVLHITEGFARAFYGPTRYGQSDVWIEYNDRNLLLKKANFTSGNSLKILVVGNSYARDFLNVMREAFDLSGVELVYRIDMYDCDVLRPSDSTKNLVQHADVILLGSGKFTPDCVRPLVAWAAQTDKKAFYVGFKDFGYNLNHVKWKRALRTFVDSRVLYARRLDTEMAINAENSSGIPAANYIPLMPLLSVGDRVRITDDSGRMLSVDRTHLTQPGAVFLGRLFHDDPNGLSGLLRERGRP